MLYFWLFQIASLIFLFISRYFIDVLPEVNMLILSLMLLVATPIIVPLVALIREDITPSRPIFTRAGIIGILLITLISLGLFFGLHIATSTLIFSIIALVATYFRIESRVFFLGALLSLIVTVSALLVEKSVLAESASVIVYLALVLGVLVEIASPLFERFHTQSHKIIHISDEFIEGYGHALADYAWILTLSIESLYIVALIGRGSVWNFEYQMLLYLAFGIWIFFALFLFTTRRIHHISDFLQIRFSRAAILSYYHDRRHYPKYIFSLYQSKHHYLKYILPGAIILTLIRLIDWIAIWHLPIITLLSLITLISVLIAVSVYGIISFFYRR